MNKPASLAELDKLQSIHPFTNLRKHAEIDDMLARFTRALSDTETYAQKLQ